MGGAKKILKKVKKTLDKWFEKCYIISVMRNKKETKSSKRELLSIINEDIKDVQFSIQNNNDSNDFIILKGLLEEKAKLEAAIEEEERMNEDEIKELFGDVIYEYTSEQAVNDGFLVRIPKACAINLMTNGVYSQCIEPFVLRDVITQKIIRGTSPLALMKKLVSRVEAAVLAQIKSGKAKRDDWFYSVEASGWKFFVAQNESGKFTMMFPEEY